MRAAGVADSEIRNMYSEALERLIENKLIETVVTRFELQATEGEVDAAIMGIAQDTGLSIEQLQRSVESHGLSIQEYRAKLKGEIERSKVLNAMVRSRVRVELDEVRRAYEERFGDQPEGGGAEVHLRHILVSSGGTSTRSTAAACEIVEEAERRIKSGEIAFPEMARRVTDMNPQAGGDLGWLFVADLAPWMAGPVAKMEPGDVSDPIETAFGCNLLQLVERRTFEPVTFEQAEEALTEELSRQKMDKEYLDWLESLRKQTFVSRKGLYAEGRRRTVEDGAIGVP
jgi:peptidyl-prolyl cis-trans isomerase SurA